MNSKILIAISAIAFMISGAAAQDSNSTKLWNVSDQVIQSGNSFQGDAFTAESLGNFSAEVSLDANESLSATLKGWNSSEKTGNQSFDLVDGKNKIAIDESSFGANASTYLVEIEAENGSVSLLSAEITGTEANQTVSGAAPGGSLLTGNFFAGIPDPLTAIADIFNGIASWLGGLIP